MPRVSLTVLGSHFINQETDDDAYENDKIGDAVQVAWVPRITLATLYFPPVARETHPFHNAPGPSVVSNNLCLAAHQHLLVTVHRLPDFIFGLSRRIAAALRAPSALQYTILSILSIHSRGLPKYAKAQRPSLLVRWPQGSVATHDHSIFPPPYERRKVEGKHSVRNHLIRRHRWCICIVASLHRFGGPWVTLFLTTGFHTSRFSKRM
ncbi:hypothetical protein LZ31DRAFT_555056 [Colletotrichum somersetense]|nr:hypothetical protein LZ31DRAFT_555056 [Colletotrichum somersetense]